MQPERPRSSAKSNDRITKKRRDHRTGKRSLANAGRLRGNMTEAEKRIWYLLRRHQFGGLNFRRQAPIDPYIVDFACLSIRLVIELDGGQHDANAKADAQRTAFLQSQGYRVLRFWNNEVFENLDAVLREISLACGVQAPMR